MGEGEFTKTNISQESDPFVLALIDGDGACVGSPPSSPQHINPAALLTPSLVSGRFTPGRV